jgi:hypothetical protein
MATQIAPVVLLVVLLSVIALGVRARFSSSESIVSIDTSRRMASCSSV